MKSSLLFSALLSVSAHAAEVFPGIPWNDTDGNELQAHGGGLVVEGDTYYLIGENKTSREGNDGGSHFNSVSCYQSTNLLDWEFVNDLLSLNTSIPDLSEDRLIERPKVVYNENTSKYVMWMHVDSTDYGDAKAGVATSDSVCGDYTYIESVNPMDNQSRDMTLFVDNDNTGYLISEDRDAGTHFYQLSDDYLTVESDVGVISFDSMDGLESPAVVNVDGVYYFFGSQLTGWDPNDNQYTTADSLSGPWAEEALLAPEGGNTCTSQTTYVLPTGNGTFLYMGDRWQQDSLWDSRYIWLPLTIDSSARTASVACVDSWDTSEIGL